MDLLATESIVKTQLEVRLKKKLGKKYPKLTVTNIYSEDNPNFPNVYVHELEPSEVGMDLSNQRIHAKRSTIQINVSANTTLADALAVSNACVEILKLLRYTIIVFPTHMETNNLYTYVIRARRIIALGDEFN